MTYKNISAIMKVIKERKCMIYKIYNKNGGYINSFFSFDEAFEENDRLRRVHPAWQTRVVAELEEE